MAACSVIFTLRRKLSNHPESRYHLFHHPPTSFTTRIPPPHKPAIYSDTRFTSTQAHSALSRSIFPAPQSSYSKGLFLRRWLCGFSPGKLLEFLKPHVVIETRSDYTTQRTHYKTNFVSFTQSFVYKDRPERVRRQTIYIVLMTINFCRSPEMRGASESKYVVQITLSISGRPGAAKVKGQGVGCRLPLSLRMA